MNLLHRIAENAFFSVDNRSYWQARHYGLDCHLFQCLSKTSDDIHGQILLPKTNAIKGTVFYCHPAIFNLEFNLPQVAFLCQEGYQVVMFDYAGCGQSSGKTQLDGLYTDTQAAFDWWKQSDYFSPKVALFAQGVGCDAALQLYEEESDLIDALILESPYCTRKGWIIDRWGPFLGHIAASQLITFTHEPAEIISNVKVPLLLIYPEHDQHTHKSEKQALLKLIPPTTTIWDIPKKKFLQTFGDKSNEWHERLIRYLSQKLP